MNCSPSSNNGKSDEEDRVPCVVCKEPIRLGAKVCIHCERSQSRIRFFKPCLTFITAAVSLLTLVSVAISLYQMIPNPANLSVILMALNQDNVEFSVANIGDKPGMIRQVKLSSRMNGTVNNFLLTETEGEKIIEAHKTTHFKYRYLIDGVPAPFPGAFANVEKSAYILSIQTVDAEGNQKQLEVPLNNPEVANEKLKKTP